MRQLQLIAHGGPSNVIELNTVSEPALGQEDVLISMEVTPPNPSDFLFVRATAFASACSAELLSDAAKDFVGESRILHGAGQYNATDHRRCPKNGLFPVSTPSVENVLKSLLKRSFQFRGRASHLLGQCGHGAAVAWMIPVPPAQVQVSKRSFARLTIAALYAP
jgi:hypothetical protein